MPEIPRLEEDLNIIQLLDDYPNDVDGLSAGELKAKFDESGLTIKEYINDVLIPAIIAGNIPFARTTSVPADTIREAILNVQQQAAAAATGTIPNGSIARIKFVQELNDYLDTLRSDATQTAALAEETAAGLSDLEEQHEADVEELSNGLSSLGDTVTQNYDHFTAENERLDNTDSTLAAAAQQDRQNMQSIDTRLSAVSESALWNSAFGLLAAAHAGRNVSLSEAAFVDAFVNSKKTASYSNLLFGENGAEILRNGYSGESGSLDHLDVPSSGAEVEMCSFRPSGFGQMTKITLTGTQTYASGNTIHAKLYSNGTLIEDKTTTIPSTTGITLTFTFNTKLDPNLQYTVKVSRGHSTNSSVQILSWEITASPLTYTSGSFLSKQISVPAGTTKMRFMCSSNSAGYTVSVSKGSGSPESLTLERSTDDGVHLATAQETLASETVQLTFNLTGAGTSIMDYAVIFV